MSPTGTVSLAGLAGGEAERLSRGAVISGRAVGRGPAVETSSGLKLGPMGWATTGRWVPARAATAKMIMEAFMFVVVLKLLIDDVLLNCVCCSQRVAQYIPSPRHTARWHAENWSCQGRDTR